jgi:hypothetical protein
MKVTPRSVNRRGAAVCDMFRCLPTVLNYSRAEEVGNE